MKVEKIDAPVFVLEVEESTAAKILGLLHLADWETHTDLEDLAGQLYDVGLEEDSCESEDPVSITFFSEQE